MEARPALDDLFSLTYEELRRLAAAVRRGDPCFTLNTTALVHEAWLKLSRAKPVSFASPLHFKRIAARAMRQLLVDEARRRNAQKRGGEGILFITLGTCPELASSCDEELLALDEALQELESFDPRLALIVESLSFSGFTVAETASLLEISESTVEREFRLAKAWLAHKLRPAN